MASWVKIRFEKGAFDRCVSSGVEASPHKVGSLQKKMREGCSEFG
jgi:hypothetical protein